MQIKHIIQFLDRFAPPVYQESYDNAGLITGNSEQNCSAALLTLDVTEAVIDEAISKNCNLIIAHHPIIFKGMKKINGSNQVERCVIKAIKNDIAIFASHTNLDAMKNGVNFKIAEKIGLQAVSVLAPKPQTLSKLVTFVPIENTPAVLQALHAAGAGNIGNYSECSFEVTGTGSFKPNAEANPFIGKAGELEKVPENRLELIFPSYLKNALLSALRSAHPYEEVAYYISNVENENQEVGSGAIGKLPEAIPTIDFMLYLKQKMNVNVIRHTALVKEKVQNIAVCGGTGSFLLSHAIRKKADVFISADFKYHEFFNAENQIIIADIGH
ncbi:MAG: Nif3-like dinuclear metal center hexameric protein, partial [Verrucomicrobia bacterium]|nr:Nif3-like dinuclear metal center hexameric protein [Cytophagales bacterium]